MRLLITFCIIYGFSRCRVFGSETFIVSFPKPQEWSKDRFVEFPGTIPELKEFTACHWQKDEYFSEGHTPVWSLCTAKTKDNDGFKCFGVYMDGLVSTVNRHIKFGGWFEGWPDKNVEIVANINSYRHRRWNHYCWSYSSNDASSKLFYNGMRVGEVNLRKEFPGLIPPVPKGTKEGNYSAFIIGQDQDGVRENYLPLQSLFGNISNLNIWDRIQSDKNIAALADCRLVLSGNVVAWNKADFEFNNVQITDIADDKIFCTATKDYIIVPKKMSLSQTVDKCASIGGNVVAPESQTENEKVLEILSKHSVSCMPKHGALLFNYEKYTWLGVVKLESKWFRMYYDTERRYKSLNYTNWGREYKAEYSSKNGCSYIKINGTWGFDKSTVCDELRLCGICSIEQTPVFTLKGLCERGSTVEWNYYPMISENHQIQSFDGYKNRALLRNLNETVWQIETEEAKIKIDTKLMYPVGRLMWNWYEESCGFSSLTNRQLTLSVCEIGTQFTCNSGRCISMNQRCDRNYDCTDKQTRGITSKNDLSDEEHCEPIWIPKNSYNKILPPPLQTGKSDHPVAATAIRIKVLIKGVDLIDTVKMRIGISMQIRMRWIDPRLDFKDMFPKERKVLDHNTTQKLWIPLDHVIHENAIIGRIRRDTPRQMYVNVMSNVSETSSANASIKLNPYSNHEHVWYDGSSSELEVRQRFRITYNCTYQLVSYPFDEQRCQFKMKIKALNGRNVSFVKDYPGVLFQGDKLIQQFRVVNVTSYIGMSQDKYFNGSISLFTIELKMDRNSYDQIQMIFIPTFLLWFVSYMTLYVNLEDFGNRCKISVSILLILVSLLGASRNDFPKTTYFKFIDLWFFWYILNIFLIILHHIMLENIDKARKEWKTFSNGNLIKGPTGNFNAEPSLVNRYITKAFLNRIAKILFLIANAIFVIIYICLGFLQIHAKAPK